MRVLVQRISANVNYSKILEWSKLILITSSAQILIQAVGLISGILIIRRLPTHEYALYTLANSMLGTMTVLADGGISTSVMAMGGKVWNDKKKLGVVFATGLYLRKKLAIVSLVIAIPILLYLLILHHASWFFSLLIILSIIPYFSTALYGTLLQTAPKLHQDIAVLQKNQIALSLGRLMLLTLTLFIFPYSFVAILAAGLPQILANKHLRKTSAGYTDWNQKWDPKIRKEMLAFVKRILPGSIYYCLSGQITIWFVSVLGSTLAVAQLGALGRLAMILSLFNVLFATLISPRFAKLESNQKLLLSRFIQIQFGLVILSLFIIGLAWIFSVQILWVLGTDYSSLKSELVLNLIGSCLGLIAGVSFNLSTSRGWAINPLIIIPVNIASIVLGILLFDVSTIEGILYLNIFILGIEVLMNGLYTLIKILKI